VSHGNHIDCSVGVRFNTFSATSIAFRLQHVLNRLQRVLSGYPIVPIGESRQPHRLLRWRSLLLFGFNTLSIVFNMFSIGFNTLFLFSNWLIFGVFNTHFPPLVCLGGAGISSVPWHFFS
jgi:hypothetical protein